MTSWVRIHRRSSLHQHFGHKCKDNMKGTVVVLPHYLHSETLILSAPPSRGEIENEKQRNRFKNPSYNEVE